MYAHYRQPYLQRGRGIGNVLNHVYKSLMPSILTFANSSTGKTIKSIALQGVKNMVMDAIRGGNVAQSMNKNLRTAQHSVVNALNDRRPSVSVINRKRPKERSHAVSLYSKISRKPKLVMKRPVSTTKHTDIIGRRSVFANGNSDDSEDSEEKSEP